jgi:hypothetical protein
MFVGHIVTNLSVNPHEGRRSDIGLTLRNARDVLLHRMPGYAVDLAFPIWKVEDVTEMKKGMNIWIVMRYSNGQYGNNTRFSSEL